MTIPEVPLEGPLPPMEVPPRLGRLRAELTASGLSAALITHPTNIGYLTGFTGSAGMLVVLPDAQLLVTDGRYEQQVAEELAASGVEATVAIETTAAAQRQAVAEAVGARSSLALEAAHVSWATQRAMASTWFPEVELVPTEGLVEALRAIKDRGEVARIERAAAIASEALRRVVPLLVQEITEHDLGLALDAEIRNLGAEGNSFETIVASGPNGAKPHHRAAGSPRRIVDGDLVVMDFGAVVDGYCSDMTRTFAIGELTAIQRRMLEVVTEAQAAGVAEVAAGRSGRAVDEACRATIRAAGWESAFNHGTGHGVGLDIHEDPRVSWSADATLAAGHVVTVEPGVYFPEHGGVRIEDTVVVTDDGCRPLTHAPKEPDPRSWL